MIKLGPLKERHQVARWKRRRRDADRRLEKFFKGSAVAHESNTKTKRRRDVQERMGVPLPAACAGHAGGWKCL